eukprot:4787042-Pleurochrysis_carterae.AAC.4
MSTQEPRPGLKAESTCDCAARTCKFARAHVLPPLNRRLLPGVSQMQSASRAIRSVSFVQF